MAEIIAKVVTGPEASEVTSMISRSRNNYREYVAIAKHLRKLRVLKLDDRNPQIFAKMMGPGIRVPLAYSLAQTVNGMVAKSPPRFFRTPLKPDDKSREAAANLARTCWPLIQTYSRLNRADVLYNMTDALANDGQSVWKMRRRPIDYPVQGDGEKDRDYNRRVREYEGAATPGDRARSALRVKQVDATTFWPSLDDDDEPFVIESGRRPYEPTIRNLGLKGDKGALRPDRPVGSTVSEEMVPGGFTRTAMVDELWTDEYCYYRCEGQVFRYENEFGFIPYSWRTGMTTSIPDPAMQRLSILYPYFAMEPHINTLLTQMVAWAIASGMPTLAVTTKPGPGVSASEATGMTDLPLGKMVTLPPGREMSYITPPPIGNTITEAVNMFLSLFDRAGVTQAVRGVTGTRMPGLTLTTAIEAAEDMFIPLFTNGAALLEDICVMTWKAVEKLDLKLDITGQTLLESGRKQYSSYQITPKMINGYYDLRCEIKPMSDQQLVQRGMHASFMQRGGLWSWPRAAEFGGVDNPIAEWREIMNDKVRQSPLYMQLYMTEALQDDPELAQTVETAAEQGIDLFGTGMVDNAGATGQSPAGGGGGGEGQGQIREEGAPAGGGRPAGMPRRPTGSQPGAYNQGTQSRQ